MLRDQSAVGCLGILTIGTRGRGGPGELVLSIRGGSQTYLAWSDEPMPRGTTVLVVESYGARTVSVVVWRDPSALTPRAE